MSLKTVCSIGTIDKKGQFSFSEAFDDKFRFIPLMQVEVDDYNPDYGWSKFI